MSAMLAGDENCPSQIGLYLANPSLLGWKLKENGPRGENNTTTRWYFLQRHTLKPELYKRFPMFQYLCVYIAKSLESLETHP